MDSVHFAIWIKGLTVHHHASNNVSSTERSEKVRSILSRVLSVFYLSQTLGFFFRSRFSHPFVDSEWDCDLLITFLYLSLLILFWLWSRTDEKGLISRVKYNNTLPDFPFDPKFIVYPFDPDRYVHYKPTSLETNHKHDLLTEQDLGVTVDLVDSDVYTIPPEYQAHGGVMPLPLEDEKLLEEEVTPQNDAKRSRQHNKVIPWLKKTEYISTEFNRYGACSEKTETKYDDHSLSNFTFTRFFCNMQFPFLFPLFQGWI